MLGLRMARTYQNLAEHKALLDAWLQDDNFHRSHASPDLKPSVSRVDLNRNNLLSLHS